MDLQGISPNAPLHWECYSEGQVAPMTALARFRLRVIEVLDARGLTQKSIRGTKTEGWIANIIAGRRNLRLDDAEAIADALQMPLSELVRRADDRTYELDNLESLLVETFRQFHPDEQKALLTIVTLRQRPAPYAAGKQVAPARATTTSRGAAYGGASSARVAADPERVSHILAKAVADIFQPEAGGQAATPRTASTGSAADRRKVRRSGAKPA